MEELLIELGFNENEARLYEALLELSEGTVDEIARVARVRRPTAYKVLRSMVSRGFIAELPGRPIKYRMLDPEETLRDLFQQRYEEINKLREILPKQFEDFLKQAEEKYRGGAVSLTDANKDFVVLRGIKTVTRIVQELDLKAKDKVRGMGIAPAPSEEELKMIVEEVKKEKATLDGGSSAELNLILEEETLKSELLRQFLAVLESRGAKIRTLKKIPIEFTVYDDYAAMICLDTNFQDPIVLFIQNRSLVKFLKEAFDLFWQKAKEIRL